jgi:5-methylthioadenosine/S-adenosylhomocysteine deaminase
VDTTIVDGKILMAGRRLLSLDENQIRTEANTAFQRVLKTIQP